MKKFLPIIFFFAIVVFFSRPFLLRGQVPIPADALVGLYNPYRDLYASFYPRGIPFKNFLITDPVRQQYPWRFLSIDQLKHGKLPIWNPYNFAGSPLLGTMQGASFYPLNLLFFILPFPIAWSIQVLFEPLLSGLFMYFYLKKLKIAGTAALFGGIVYAFSGFSVSWLEWNTVLHVTLWLPLILLIKEKLLEKFTIKFAILLIFAEISAVFAGYLQILFYALCISNLYLFVRIMQKSKEKKGNVISAFIRLYAPFLLVGIVIFGIAMVQLFPTMQTIFYSARDLDQSNLWQNSGWFIPWQHLIQFFAPDFFGNPATLNYWGVWNYAELVGYVGIVPLIFALFAILSRWDKKTLFFGALLLISFLFSLPTILAKIPFALGIPFISTSQPTRLIFVADFSLAILSALGFDYFLRNPDRSKNLISVVFVIFTFIFLALWAIILWKIKFFGMSSEQFVIARQNIILPSAIFAIFVLFAVAQYIVPLRLSLKSIILIIAIILLTVFDLLRFAEKFTPFSSPSYLFPETGTIKFLKQNIGNYRFMTTDSKIFPPNVSTMYKLQTVDGYDPLYLRNYGELIAASERGKPNIQPPFGFNRIITPHSYSSKIMDLLGVKYVLSLSDLSEQKLKKVYQEGETRVYENMRVLPRAFFVKSIFQVNDKQEAINSLFDVNYNYSYTAVITDTGSGTTPDTVRYLAMHRAPTIFSLGKVKISQYSENSVKLETENTQNGFLILTDIYYPYWHAAVDGEETKIYQTDYAMRGIFVPKGKHTVIFKINLL